MMQLISGGYSPSQVAQITGITFHMINQWDQNGLIIPSILQSRGRGRIREYSFDDVIAIKVVGELRASGLPMQSVRKVLDYMRSHKLIRTPLSSSWIVTDGVDVYEPKSEAELLSIILQPGQRATKVTLDLKKAVDDLIESADSAQHCKTA